jgi:two-component system cell cycle sensor histidine kinase/response regulator CckA
MPEPVGDDGQAERALCFDRVTDALFLFAHDHRLRDVNASGCIALGSSRADLLGRPLAELFPPTEAEPLGTILDRLQATGGARWGSLLVRPDGTRLPVEVHGQPRSQGPGALLLLVAQDLSGQRRETCFREQVSARAGHAARLESLALLCRYVIHAYANTITSVQAIADSARIRLPAGDPSGQHLDAIGAAAGRASVLLHELRQFVTRRPGAWRPVDLNAVVLEMSRILDLAAAKVHLLRELQDGLPLVQGDPAQLGQILLSLLLNAVEAVGAGPASILVRTTYQQWVDKDLAQTRLPEVLSPGAYVALSVSDTGPGMSPEVQRRAFELFYSTKPTGTGLGLGLVPDVMQRSGGAVLLESSPGVGTCFTLLFPALPVPKQEP